ncbi:MAG: ring-hydroxylating oxygenase subunit alpha [Granulosicoccus sp.]|nr:ring-hydroxylating oxygenase subunit alpha [Granulosicoccus sp.]
MTTDPHKDSERIANRASPTSLKELNESVVSFGDVEAIEAGYDPDPSCSLSLHADAYTESAWHSVDNNEILKRTWQWVCHVEKTRKPGSFVTTEIAGQPIAVVRDNGGQLRAFYNVCKHRAHQLLSGEGSASLIVCPYHAWTYKLSGQLHGAPHTQNLKHFDREKVCLDAVQVEEFCGFVFVNLDPTATSLVSQSGNLQSEILHWAPDVENLTFAHRLRYDIRSNWKNVVDNFLECYHCPVAHKDFCELVDMKTYKVTTYDIYSSHMADAGDSPNAAYDVSGATVKTHAVWWLWPTTCLMRYPGRSSMIVLNIIPIAPDRTLETYDFFLETTEPNAMEQEAIRYLDEVLQVEDIKLVESVQKGMLTPAFNQGRIVHDPSGSGKSEHALHHFHGLVLGAYRRAVA